MLDLRCLAQSLTTHHDPDARSLAGAVLAWEEGALYALHDWCEENREMGTPFKVEDVLLIKTVTLYYVGRVAEVGPGWLRLEGASWVHWTGRLGSLLASGDLAREHGGRQPRTEYVGEVTLFCQAFVAAYPWRGTLPERSLP